MYVAWKLLEYLFWDRYHGGVKFYTIDVAISPLSHLLDDTVGFNLSGLHDQLSQRTNYWINSI